MKKLQQDFYKQSTLLVAEKLLGKILVFRKHQGIITETEAYMGFDDEASHAFKGITPRSKVMFGRAGFSYVYLIYGLYHCLNIVTEEEGFPAAILIRGLKLLDKKHAGQHLDGPGKICRYLGITKAQNAIDITQSKELYVGCIKKQLAFKQSTRLGIKVGTDKPWRFLAEDF